MLRAVPKSWLSSGYRVLEENTAIAILDLSRWREAGLLTISGSTYRVYRKSLMSGLFLLENGGSILARATKPSALYRSFLVEAGGRQYKLEAESALYRKFILTQDGNQIGSVYPESAFSNKAVIELPEEIALSVRLFMFWLVIVLWNRGSEAASS
jgi:hypothetical protein